ncbi:MAG: hypothetical protein KGD64_06850 [Candidatus Heimdallarchaeota archaeon]|nr:hypothetical protein [Candidatus Heimdallarchaeota archaeon]
MTDTLPTEILAHQNRISPELREFLIETLQGSFTPEASVQIGRILWNIVEDPVYEGDEELKYLASKIGVMVGQYDLSIKCITDTIVGTKVWGSVALFEIGEIDQAFSYLQHVIENENTDFLPLIEAIFWIVYMKLLIGDTEDLESYKNRLNEIFTERNIRLLPQHFHQIKDFTEGIIELQSANNIAGLKSIEDFLHDREAVSDQYWQLLALLTLGEQTLDSSDYISSGKIYARAKQLGSNLSNIPLSSAADIGITHAHYLKGELKAGNILAAQTIEKLQGMSQYYLGKAHFARGRILAKLGHHKMARDNFNTSYSLANQYRDFNRAFLSLIATADNFIAINESEKAQEIYDKAYNQIVNIANKRQFAKALVQIAMGEFRQGNIKNALVRVNQIETLSEEILYQKGKTDALRLRAQIAINLNEDIKKQIFVLRACQILYLEVGDEESNANCDILIAEACTRLGNNDEAAVHLENAKNFYLKISESIKIAEIKELQSSFDLGEGRFDEALVKLRSSYSHYSDVFDRNRRVRCLRKIADILAIKGDFRESVSRYKKVEGLIGETENRVEKVIISLNKARIYLFEKKFTEALESYKVAESFLIEHNVKEVLNQVLVEKCLLYIYNDDFELFSETIDQIKEQFEDQKEVDLLTKFLHALQQIRMEKYTEAYSNLIEVLQKTFEGEHLISVNVLFNLIFVIVKLNIENLSESFVKEEINNYLGFISSITKEFKYYYLRGLSYLVELLWRVIEKGDKSYNEILVQASEYYASTGIEQFGSKLLILQYNIGLWEDQEDTRLREILGVPKKYGSQEEAFLEFLEDATRAMLIEELLDTEKILLESMLTKE